MDEDSETIREAALAEKVEHLVSLVAALAARVDALERRLGPNDPDPEIGLP